MAGAFCLGAIAGNLFAAQFAVLPAAPDMPAEVRAQIETAWSRLPAQYQPRTRHAHPDGMPVFANRLLLESSPYLLQHAHNPVNWYPWGDAAFAQAQLTGQPILISIGYSSCHWCHVMAEESYADLKIAEFINAHFIAVKVDREVHPEVDAIYLLAAQLAGSGGGWPLHAFLTPDGKPFFGLTYLPPAEFSSVLDAVIHNWTQEREKLLFLANQITQTMQMFETPQAAAVEIGKPQIRQVIAELVAIEEEADGFPPASASFPLEAEMLLLLDAAARQRNAEALRLAENRLQNMAFGGIHDHIGGGFHRYTIDGEWQVPHFEKMLYNQAHIGRSYLYAYLLTGAALYRQTVESTLDYVLREMTSDNGLFYAATDAASEGEEGKYFVWSLDEIAQVTGADFELIARHYGATAAGNHAGGNVLHVDRDGSDRAAQAGLTPSDYAQRVAAATEKMRVFRERRIKPFRDEKVITTWNAAFITTLAKVGAAFDNARYLKAAVTAAESLWQSNQDAAQLYRFQIEGQPQEPAILRDYAYFVQALLAIYDATAKAKWLQRAEQLMNMAIMHLWDLERGGFFSVKLADAAGQIVRRKDRLDEALPAGNSVAALALAQLSQRTGNQLYARYAQQIFDVFAGEISEIPTSFPYMLRAFEEFSSGAVFQHDYFAFGQGRAAVTAAGRQDDGISATVTLALQPGWHVQASEVPLASLTPTSIQLATANWEVAEVAFPPAKTLRIESLDTSLSVWSDQARIPVTLRGEAAPLSMPIIRLDLQACNDEVCLLPESILLEIPYAAITD